MNLLEERLRTQLDEAARAVVIPGDAWQEHERRLAARRQARWQKWGLSAAAVVTMAALGWMVTQGAVQQPTPPAGIGQLSDRTMPELREGVIVDRREFPDGSEVSLLVAMADVREHTTDPDLCSMLMFTRDGSRGASYECHRPVDGANQPPHAIDYVSLTTIDGRLTTLVGAVDERVALVEAELRDGSRQRLPLRSLTGTERRGFGLVTEDEAQFPQHLVAYDESGQVLQGHPLR